MKFGYYLNGLKFLAAAAAGKEEANLLNVPGERWSYFGPNVTHITLLDKEGKDIESFVMRLYDNRVRQTPRSPDFYQSKLYRHKSYKALEVHDDISGPGGEIRPFRDAAYYKTKVFFCNDNKGGKVVGILVPFIAGNHYFENAAQALCVVNELDILHENSCVHGDIRALNIVVDGDTAEFIDFNFCGEINVVTYPPGYNKALLDGKCRGKPGEKITKEDDISALKNVFGLHVKSPHYTSSSAWIDALEQLDSLSDMKRYLQDLVNDQKEGGKFQLNKTSDFRLFLQEWQEKKSSKADAEMISSIIVTGKVPQGTLRTSINF